MWEFRHLPVLNDCFWLVLSSFPLGFWSLGLSPGGTSSPHQLYGKPVPLNHPPRARCLTFSCWNPKWRCLWAYLLHIHSSSSWGEEHWPCPIHIPPTRVNWHAPDLKLLRTCPQCLHVSPWSLLDLRVGAGEEFKAGSWASFWVWCTSVDLEVKCIQSPRDPLLMW